MGEVARIVEAGQGLERLSPRPDPRSTRWWFYVTLEDGFQFARGGRCPSARIARTLILGARAEMLDELAESRDKYAYVLGPRGELVPVRDGRQLPAGVGSALPAQVELGPGDPDGDGG